MVIDGIWISPSMVDQVAEITGNHRKTVLRWMRNREFPTAIRRLLDLLHNGNLGAINPAWDGWALHADTGELRAPEDTTWRAGDVRAMQLRYHEISALKLKIRQLQAIVDATQLAGTTPAVQTIRRSRTA